MANIGYAAFVDVETTGFKPPEDEIVELAIVLFTFDKDNGDITGIVQEYSGLRDPGRSIPPAATRVHGIKAAQVKGKRLDDAAITGILSRASFVVAHNAKFDYQFCNYYLPEFGKLPWYCSMKQVNWPGTSCGLNQQLDGHGIINKAAHRALSDVRAALELLRCHADDGQPYFSQLLDAAPMAKSKLMPFEPIRVTVKHKRKYYWHWYIILPIISLIIFDGYGLFVGLAAAGFIHWRGKKAAYGAGK